MQSQSITSTTARYVRSFTNPNQFYIVALNQHGFLECDCPAAQFNRRTPCKHVKAVAKTDAGLVAKPKASAQPPVRPAYTMDTQFAVASLDI